MRRDMASQELYSETTSYSENVGVLSIVQHYLIPFGVVPSLLKYCVLSMSKEQIKFQAKSMEEGLRKQTSPSG